MDIFSLFAIKNELNEKIKGLLVKKIYHKDYELLFKVFKKNLYINISPQSQVIFFTDKKISHGEKPTSFCMILRKYLQGKRIKKICLPFFYRILEFDFNDVKFLIKFTGKSSDYILCDKDYNIIFSFKEGKGKGKFSVTEPEIIKNFEDFKNANFKLEGLPPFVLKELKFIAENKGIEKSWDFYKKLINFEIEFKPVKISKKIYPFILEHLKKEDGNIEILENFTEISDFHPDYKSKLLKFLNEKIKKIKKTISIVEDELKKAKEFKKYQEYGEIIKQNLYNPDNIKSLNIPIRQDISLIENMQNFFEKAKKLKRAVEKLNERKQILENELEFYENLKFYAENSSNLEELKNIGLEAGFETNEIKGKIQKTSSLYEETYIDGVKVYIGKSAKGNDFILRNFGKPDFLWCHAKNVPGAHVVVCEEFEKLNEKVIENACKLALFHSKAKNDKKGEVIYTKIKYIKKTKNAPFGLVKVLKENVMMVRLS